MAGLPPSRQRRYGEPRRSSHESFASGGGKASTTSNYRTTGWSGGHLSAAPAAPFERRPPFRYAKRRRTSEAAIVLGRAVDDVARRTCTAASNVANRPVALTDHLAITGSGSQLTDDRPELLPAPEIPDIQNVRSRHTIATVS